MYTRINLDYKTLEPYISDKTLTLHYNNHYLKYLNNLNEILKENNYDFKDSKEELFKNIDQFPIGIRDKILFNLGGVVNHELYFNNISMNKKNEPIASIKEAIDEEYGNYEIFKEKFKKSAKNLVGSGYTFLVLNKSKLQIINMSNQESPYMYNMIPIIALDLWEHAYYLDYQNNKDKYIDTFFEIIDFNKVNSIYEKNKI